MRSRHLASQRTRIGQQVNIAAVKPAHLTAAQPGTGHQQHDQPVTGRQARAQQRDDLLIAGPVHRTLVLPQAVPCPHPPRHPAIALAPGELRKITVISNFIQHRNQMRWRLSRHRRVHDEAAHRGQHRVNPPGAPGRPGTRPGEHLPGPSRRGIRAAGLRPGMPKPGHEQPEMLRTRLPGPPRQPAPPQEQRDRTRIRSRRQFRAVPPEPDLPQERVRLRDKPQFVIKHRPVPLSGRQPHRKSPHPHPPIPCPTAITTISNKNNTGADTLRNKLRVALSQRHTTAQRPRENAQHRAPSS